MLIIKQDDFEQEKENKEPIRRLSEASKSRREKQEKLREIGPISRPNYRPKRPSSVAKGKKIIKKD